MLAVCILAIMLHPAVHSYGAVIGSNKAVKSQENARTEKKVTGIDLGKCPGEMNVGSEQYLDVSVLPSSIRNPKLKYRSNHPKIASVNKKGRIVALSVGEAVITVSCGKVSSRFRLLVVSKEKEEQLPSQPDGWDADADMDVQLPQEEETVPVTGIELNDYEKELEVEKTMTLSATVLPATATDAGVTYTSSNPSVATVNSSGEVKGIAPGTVTITASAGGKSCQAFIQVKVATKAIQLDCDYFVKKAGSSFRIQAEVVPQGADQKLNYRSLKPEIANVTQDGVVTALAVGNTAIMVSNGDLQVAVTIIVNTEKTETAEKEKKSEKEQKSESGVTFPSEVSVQEYPVITKEMLHYFYQEKEILTVTGDGYTLLINGADIVNEDNELRTSLQWKKEKEGISFQINDGENLCGAITVKLEAKEGKYLYLYNTQKKRYELLESDTSGELRIDTPGNYLWTDKKQDTLHLSVFGVVGGAFLLLTGTGVYIGVKKQYWFW